MKGWYYEGYRHSLAAKGIKTSMFRKNNFVVVPLPARVHPSNIVFGDPKDGEIDIKLPYEAEYADILSIPEVKEQIGGSLSEEGNLKDLMREFHNVPFREYRERPEVKERKREYNEEYKQGMRQQKRAEELGLAPAFPYRATDIIDPKYIEVVSFPKASKKYIKEQAKKMLLGELK
jgi:hypothetical protein